MATVKAIVKKGVPCCPRCNQPKTRGQATDYGVSDEGFWFSYECQCSTKKAKVTVKYVTDSDFKIAVGG